MNTASDEMPVQHAYPRELALLVRQRWTHPGPAGCPDSEEVVSCARPPPDIATLERLLSTCYQASLLREEGEPITFRIAVEEPDAFSALTGPPLGLHRLTFDRPRPLDEHELRRLAPAATFERSLIGVRVAGEGDLEIWGLLHSGRRWLHTVRGGRRVQEAAPPVFTVAVNGPGRVLVSKGPRTLAALAGGRLTDTATDVFAARWLTRIFERLVSAQPTRHALTHEPDDPTAGSLDPAFGAQLAKHALRRIVSTIRATRHGGTLIVLPSELAGRLVADRSYLTLKYRFLDEEPRRRMFSLTARIISELDRLQASTQIRWSQYQSTSAPYIAELDEALFEVAHLVAMLADVDGAVVMTDCLEILGFGAEIAGSLEDVRQVHRSLDLEGERRIAERTEQVGTRHRSCYRLCQRLHDALAIVISQDGGVRFVRWQNGSVTYFDQIAIGPWEI